MTEYKLMGTECPRTGEVHTWITRDGTNVTLEEVVEALTDMEAEICGKTEYIDDLRAHENMQLDKITEMDAEIERLRAERDECRRLLREACDMPPRLGGVGLIHTVTGDWLRAARAAGGGDE